MRKLVSIVCASAMNSRSRRHKLKEVCFHWSIMKRTSTVPLWTFALNPPSSWSLPFLRLTCSLSHFCLIGLVQDASVDEVVCSTSLFVLPSRSFHRWHYHHRWLLNSFYRLFVGDSVRCSTYGVGTIFTMVYVFEFRKNKQYGKLFTNNLHTIVGDVIPDKNVYTHTILSYQTKVASKSVLLIGTQIKL
jgi:hypothetical protein